MFVRFKMNAHQKCIIVYLFDARLTTIVLSICVVGNCGVFQKSRWRWWLLITRRKRQVLTARANCFLWEHCLRQPQRLNMYVCHIWRCMTAATYIGTIKWDQLIASAASDLLISVDHISFCVFTLSTHNCAVTCKWHLFVKANYCYFSAVSIPYLRLLNTLTYNYIVHSSNGKYRDIIYCDVIVLKRQYNTPVSLSF